MGTGDDPARAERGATPDAVLTLVHQDGSVPTVVRRCVARDNATYRVRTPDADWSRIWAGSTTTTPSYSMPFASRLPTAWSRSPSRPDTQAAISSRLVSGPITPTVPATSSSR